MAGITLQQVDQLGNKFSLSFKLDGTAIPGYPVTVEFPVKKRCKKKLFSFLFFVDDCDPPSVEPLISTQKYDTGASAYIFKGAIMNEEDDGPCKFFTFRWKAWKRTLPNPLNPISGTGEFKAGFFGKAMAELEEVPDWSAEQLFKVCCVKAKDGPGCELECTKL